MPDPNERADPAQRRRVPPVDETTVAVERAQASLAEIAQRHAADTARAEADAADREAAEAARRAELVDWSVDATDTETAMGVDDVLTREP